MAGMFYSLQEVAEKLNKTEEEVKEIIKQGRLREFRDGQNLLFKVDEVEALMSDTSIMTPKEAPVETEQEAVEEEISLAPEPAETPAAAGELTDADTVAAGEEISAPGKTDTGYPPAEDMMDETKAASDEVSLASSGGEASLEEIEEDISLDSFGSGSGLLDLSLQADDTSLGGILDEIYTPEGEGGQEQEVGTPGSAMEVAAETEQMLAGEELAGTEPVPEAAAIVQAYGEPEPDTISNAFGYMLFLPLLVIVYTAIVATTGFKGVMPVILEKIQGIIWYVMIGVAVAAGLVIGAAFMLSGERAKTGKKQKGKKPAETP